MKKLWHILSCLLILQISGLGAEDNIAAAIELLKRHGINAGDTVFVAPSPQVLKIGAPAIPYLLPLLKDRHKGIRTVAARTLRDIDGLNETHLDALIAAHRRGVYWLAEPIARIGTPKAVDVLMEDLLRTQEEDIQTRAFVILGPKVTPQMVALYRKKSGWNKDFEEKMNHVWKWMGHKAVTAVPGLLEIATDKKMSEAARIRAINTLAAIGAASKPAIPTLLELHQNGSKKMQEACAAAMIETDSPESVPFLLQELQNGERYKSWTFGRIAKLHQNGITAGPAILPYVNDAFWENRREAIATLGFIGYKAAADLLIAQLGCEEDWRTVACAMEVLVKFQETKAIPPLQKVARDHWYPPLRGWAKQAIDCIQDKKPFSIEKKGRDFIDVSEALGFSTRDYDYYNDCKSENLRFPVVPQPLESIKVRVTAARKSPSEKKTQKETLSGLPHEGGHLVTYTNSDLGGFIGFVDAKGKLTEIISGVSGQAVHNTKHGLFALIGRWHFPYCRIVRIQRTPDGKWTAQDWRELPGGHVWFSGVLEDGSILVCNYGGIVKVSPDGKIHWLIKEETFVQPKKQQ